MFLGGSFLKLRFFLVSEFYPLSFEIFSCQIIRYFPFHGRVVLPDPDQVVAKYITKLINDVLASIRNGCGIDAGSLAWPVSNILNHKYRIVPSSLLPPFSPQCDARNYRTELLTNENCFSCSAYPQYVPRRLNRKQVLSWRLEW